MTKIIELTQQQITLVSDEDFEWLSTIKWNAEFKSDYADGGKFMARGSLKGKSVYVHRLVMAEVMKRPLLRTEWVDHIDGEPLNNQRENLRIVTPSQSSRNRKIKCANATGYMGVRFHRGPVMWSAVIKIDGKRHKLGMFDTRIQASEAYQKAVEELFSEYTRK